LSKKLTYEEAFFLLLDEKAGELVGNSPDIQRNNEEAFKIFKSLEDQEGMKNWVARTIDEMYSDESAFVEKGIKFLRPQAFEEPKEPEEK